MTDRSFVPLNVRRLRVERGLSQARLAERVETTQKTISDIERGLWVSPERLAAIAKALRVKPDDLTRPMSLEDALAATVNRLPRREVGVG